MAKAKVETVEKEIITKALDREVTLTLSAEEAQALRDLLAHVHGIDRAACMEAIRAELSRVGFSFGFLHDINGSVQFTGR